jgi:hypothetical protein
MRSGRWRWAAWLLVAVCCLAQMGCFPFAPAMAQISGAVYGDSISSRQAGGTEVVGVRAVVRCNSAATTTSSSGVYSLSVAIAKEYRCTASAAPDYVPVSTTIPSSAGQTITLNFGPARSGDACAPSQGPASIVCPALRLQPGILSGRIVYANSISAAAGVRVACWSPAVAARQVGVAIPPTYSAMTDDGGLYSITALPVDTYVCRAGTDPALHRIAVAPGIATAFSFPICHPTNCPPVQYHDGPVMHTYTAYLIFWLPPAYTFEPQGSSATYESLIARYFADVGGSAFYNLLTQYWDYQGYVTNSATLGGTYVDTAPYVHCDSSASVNCSPAAATRSDPLYDTDIQAEVTRALKTNRWSAGLNTQFFVFLGVGAQECINRSSTSDCSFPTPDFAICGYHGAFDTLEGTSVIYAEMNDVRTAPENCLDHITRLTNASPNGDWTADAEISVASHEQFESVTDPLPDNGAWFEDKIHAREGGEIGDKCQESFGTIQPDGSNVTLGQGHRYLLQEEWSNVADGCALSL